MVLRFFAFLYHSKQYRAPMKSFLNRYMATNRDLSRQPEKVLRDIFSRTTRTILEGIGPRAFRPKRAVNAAVVDSLMTGVARRLQSLRALKDIDSLRKSYRRLMKDAKYVQATETGTSQEANVATRLSHAEKAFSKNQ